MVRALRIWKVFRNIMYVCVCVCVCKYTSMYTQFSAQINQFKFSVPIKNLILFRFWFCGRCARPSTKHRPIFCRKPSSLPCDILLAFWYMLSLISKRKLNCSAYPSVSHHFFNDIQFIFSMVKCLYSIYLDGLQCVSLHEIFDVLRIMLQMFCVLYNLPRFSPLVTWEWKTQK